MRYAVAKSTGLRRLFFFSGGGGVPVTAILDESGDALLDESGDYLLEE